MCQTGISYPQLQRKLDRHVLQVMEECRNTEYGREEYAFPLRCFVVDPWITRDMARAICRSLTDRGFAFYMRGLFNDDGQPQGSGYGITNAGAAYLDELFSDDAGGA